MSDRNDRRWSAPPTFPVLCANGAWAKRHELDEFMSFAGRTVEIWLASASSDRSRGVRVGSFERKRLEQQAGENSISPEVMAARSGAETLAFLTAPPEYSSPLIQHARRSANKIADWEVAAVKVEGDPVSMAFWNFAGGWTAVAKTNDAYFSVVAIDVDLAEVELQLADSRHGIDLTANLDRQGPHRQNRDWQSTTLRRQKDGQLHADQAAVVQEA